jgi:3-(3-hydroxy-phenyl)propionate hydroxylase
VIQATDPTAVADRNRRFADGGTSFDFPQPGLGGTTPPVGTIFPQPRLGDGRLMDDAIGQRFAIVGETDLLQHLRPDAVLLPDVGREWLAEKKVRAALLRPDRYVQAVAP